MPSMNSSMASSNNNNIRGRSNSSGGNNNCRGSPPRPSGKSVKRLKELFSHKIGNRIATFSALAASSHSQKSDDSSSAAVEDFLVDNNHPMEDSPHSDDEVVDDNNNMKSGDSTADDDEEIKMPTTPPRKADGSAANLTSSSSVLTQFTSANSTLKLSPLRLSIFQNGLHSTSQSGSAVKLIERSLESNKVGNDEIMIEQVDSNEDNNDPLLHRDEEKDEVAAAHTGNRTRSCGLDTSRSSPNSKHVKLVHHQITSSSCSSRRHRRNKEQQQQQHQHSVPTKNTCSLNHEYNVDHSCSTPLERLTRDVGNTLRQWNVHQGCDRHVSLDWMDKFLSSTTSEDKATEQTVDNDDDDAQSLMSDVTKQDDHSTTTTNVAATATTDEEEKEEILFSPVMSMDMCERGFATRSRRIDVWMGDEDNVDDELPNKITTTSPPPQQQQQQQSLASLGNHHHHHHHLATHHHHHPFPSLESDKRNTSHPTRRNDPKFNGAQCIRRKKIEFQTVGFSPEIIDTDDTMTWKRRRYTIPLVLTLWDGPYYIPLKTTEQTSDEVDAFQDDNDNDDEVNDIPLSLRSDPSPSSFSLLGDLGMLSSSGTQRSFFHNDTNLITTSKTVAFDKSRSPLRTGFGQDLSSLFNVGQHITLCLDDVGFNSGEVQSLYSDMYSYIENQIRLANEAHRASQKERALRLKKMHRSKLQMEIDSKEEEEEVIDFENEMKVQKEESPFDDTSDTTASSDEELNQEEIGSYEEDSVFLKDYIRLNQHEMNNEVISLLASILHTALSLAASENECHIPVFGIWGEYREGLIDSNLTNNRGSKLFEGGKCAAPTWITPSTPHDRERADYDDDSKLFLSSPIIVGTCQTPTFRSTHRVYSISQQNLPAHLSTLDGLSKVLLAHCPSNRNNARVSLTAARHCYYWNRNEVYTQNKKDQSWRDAGRISTEALSEVEMYEEQCRIQALQSLERASTNSRGYFWGQSSPMWGPSEGNPLSSLSASVSWGVIPAEANNASSSNPTPLLQLPLKRRSAIAPSPAELFEMDYALQSAALNPIGVGLSDQSVVDPREPIFFASATFDNNAPCATLSANTRCVLAALIRCGSLGLDTLPGHLTKLDVLFNFSPRVHSMGPSGEVEEIEIPESELKLREAIKTANVGSVTERLVDALDWRDAKIGSSANDFRIESTSYPEPPVASLHDYSNASGNMLVSTKYGVEGKAAPPGRLLSILFAHMAKLRTPPSMMRLWLSFVADLRTRWDRNESLPNLGIVPGLDSDKRQDPAHLRLQPSNKRVLGHRADFAAFVNSSEPDPSREHCLINQKLQVFNICLECKLSSEILYEKKMKEAQRDSSCSDYSSDDEDFYDAPMEAVSFERDSDNVEEMLRHRAALPTTKHSRVGARCPVPSAMPLIESGDQVYAPYLQRTLPVTDEEEERQKRMLGVDRGNGEDRLSIQDRIKIAQRLQKPKLISDMSSFKAANHGAVFEDFVRWYGNPENPLGEELNEDSLKRKSDIRAKLSPEQAKNLALKEASEAISLLMNLRAFWEDSWDESEAEAAFEQDPLFDPYTTVEMMLHSLETIHPALLMNQVLAVNFSNARFVLSAASKQARQVRTIDEGLCNLDNAINLALEALTKDASDELGPNPPYDKSNLLTYLTTETISKCEEACNQIGEFEVLLSRSLALLQELPGKYRLVDSLLQGCTDGNFVFVKHPNDRDAFLGTIRSGQMVNVTFDPSSFFPDASMREYIMSNNDKLNPCQLNARLLPSTRGVASSFNGSLLLALSSSEHS